VAKRVQW